MILHLFFRLTARSAEWSSSDSSAHSGAKSLGRASCGKCCRKRRLRRQIPPLQQFFSQLHSCRQQFRFSTASSLPRIFFNFFPLPCPVQPPAAALQTFIRYSAAAICLSSSTCPPNKTLGETRVPNAAERPILTMISKVGGNTASRFP